MEPNDAHASAVSDAFAQLRSHPELGLTGQEAGQRAARYGPNELQERPRPGILQLLWRQFDDFLVRILIVAAVLSMALGEMADALAIVAIIALNAVLGVVQESKAEQALAALKKMAAPNARVVRDGVEGSVPARELVPGDLVVLEAGNFVPADLRLVEGHNLRVEEASLTGESVAVQKDASLVLDREAPLGDRRNSAFMGTVVAYGRGKGLVTATGMHTQIGLIADMLQSVEDEQTPLQRRLAQLGRWLGTASLAICAAIFLFGVLRDTQPAIAFTQGPLAYLSQAQHDLVELFMTAVSLAIAAVPEGLPAVVTICLALGMQRMIRRHALIRKLPAVETLGCATVICSDKTGTLTQNQMTTVQGWAAGRTFAVTGEGYSPKGTFRRGEDTFDPRTDRTVDLLLHGALLCNDAQLRASGESAGQETFSIVGDPTEGALVVAAAKAGLDLAGSNARLPRVAEIPFDSERKRMTTVHRVTTGGLPLLEHGGGSHVAFVKGAPDVVLGHCVSFVTEQGVRVLDETERRVILQANDGMARQALRVLAVAYRPTDGLPDPLTAEHVERELTFVGLLGMIDPARPEAREAVRLARQAGIKSVMVTGDYRDTAVAIAGELQMLSPGGRVLTGAELENMSAAELAEVVEQVDAYARVSPQHKMKIVDAYRARGHVVAMTGDGVNDAPALKRADIGVAMGVTGTDVAKETADMVLTDDNFASIVSAIEEGRIIYANIRKFVFYLVSCNIGEILIIFLAMLAGLPIPLRPIQLLWLNLVTDGAPALALGLERGERDIMSRPPRPVREPVINRPLMLGVAVQAVVMTGAVLGAFLYGLDRYAGSLQGAQTVAFTTLVISELLRAYTARSDRHSAFHIGLFANRAMQYAVGASLALLLVAIYLPVAQPFFGTVPLSLGDWAVILPCALLASLAAEVTKAAVRWHEGRRTTRALASRTAGEQG
jgi:P-type Ca2+ transporter type 2C